MGSTKQRIALVSPLHLGTSGGNQPITCLISRFGPPKKDKRSINLVFNLINQTIKQFFSLPIKKEAKMGILYQHSNGAVSQF